MTETVVEQQVVQAPENNVASLNQHVVMPKSGKIRYRLIDFAGRRNIIDEKKPEADGFYRNEKLKLKLAIDGNKSFNGGTEVWVDVNRGLQITDFDGVRGWKGPDGRFFYKANVGELWSLVLAAKMGDLMKYAKIAIILILVAVASPFIALLLKGA